MKIMVVGGGGRELAIIKKLQENKNVTTVYALPGNGGIAKDATCVDIGAKDIAKIVEFAVQSSIGCAVVVCKIDLSRAGRVQHLRTGGKRKTEK